MTLIILFVFGIAIGSFLNVLIDRLPRGKSIMGRSSCDHCKKTLTALDLIPLFSFLFLGGKCRRCKKRLSWQYPLVELLTGLIFVATWIQLPALSVFQRIALVGVESAFLVIFFADLKFGIIPDEMQIAALLFSVFFFLLGGKSGHQFIYSFGEGLILMLPLALINIFSLGKGMGWGDVKLAFVMGFFLGLGKGAVAVYIGFVMGAVVGLALLLTGKKKFNTMIAFGPFLAFTFLIMLLLGDQIISFLNQFLGFY